MDQNKGQQEAKLSQGEMTGKGEELVIAAVPNPISSVLVIGTWGKTLSRYAFQVVTRISSSFSLKEMHQKLRLDLSLIWMEGWEAFHPSRFMFGTPTKPWERIVMSR